MKKRGIKVGSNDSERKNSPVGGVLTAESGQLWKTREQMAERLQISVRSVDYWTADGTLPVYKKGHVVRYHPGECDRALQAFRRKSRFEVPKEDYN